MGGGSWTTKAFSDYTSRSRGVSLDEFDTMAFSAQEFYTSRKLDAALNPKGVMRECCDSDEHPHTVPVILALDVTGSMGGAAVLSLNLILELRSSLIRCTLKAVAVVIVLNLIQPLGTWD